MLKKEILSDLLICSTYVVVSFIYAFFLLKIYKIPNEVLYLIVISLGSISMIFFRRFVDQAPMRDVKFSYFGMGLSSLFIVMAIVSLDLLLKYYRFGTLTASLPKWALNRELACVFVFIFILIYPIFEEFIYKKQLLFKFRSKNVLFKVILITTSFALLKAIGIGVISVAIYQVLSVLFYLKYRMIYMNVLISIVINAIITYVCFWPQVAEIYNLYIPFLD